MKLALNGPVDVDDGYQVFANGKLLGSFGDFSGKGWPMVYGSHPMMFPLPPDDVSVASPVGVAEMVTLAFRVWCSPTTFGPRAGGLHQAPKLGLTGTVEAEYQLGKLGMLRGFGFIIAEAFLFLLLAAMSFSLILFDSSDRVYLWMGILFLIWSIRNALLALENLTQTISSGSSAIVESTFNPLFYLLWVMIWWEWFRLRRPRWLPQVATSLAVVYMIQNLIFNSPYFTNVPHSVSALLGLISMAARLGLAAMLLWIAVEGIRCRRLDGWLALPAIVFLWLVLFGTELGNLLHTRTFWFPFGMFAQLGDLSAIILVGVLALLLLRRLYLSVHRQRQMALDVKQAQEVQQVILPEARQVHPGLVIESEYLPAREVGGDFFQIIPHKVDDSMLIVVGDVTGKGLKAGMLVPLLVGAIRSVAQFDSDPLEMLKALNERLLGRGDAQATCLALRIEPDGSATLANAGHIAPYLNGEPLAMEGALPLGMIERAEFSVMRFRLSERDRLILMSDGIAEATDANGRLFGFERVHELLRRASSAADVASAAQKFGQQDDISVISVTRTSVLTPALA